VLKALHEASTVAKARIRSFVPCPALQLGFILRRRQTVFIPLTLLEKPHASDLAETHPSEAGRQSRTVRPEWSRFMKSNYYLATLLSLLLGCVIVQGQTRPRRVGNESGTTRTAPVTSSQKPELRGTRNSDTQTTPTVSQPSGPEEVDAGDIIKVNTTLVTIPVSVMDRDGRYVPNLQKDDFRLWEDGVEQEVAFFSSVEKPFSVVLMLDTSPSTQFRLEDIQDAAISFVNQLRPDDKVMVVSFNNDITVLSEFTTDRQKLSRAIHRAYTDDGTRLYDAVDMVMNRELNKIQGRKAVVLFTDGVDTTSKRASYDSTVMDAQELDALVYVVQYDTAGDMAQIGNVTIMGPGDVFDQILGGIFGGPRRRGGRGGGYPRGGGGGYPGRGIPNDYQLADQYLREIATSTGGRQYRADSLQNMSYAFANVAEELRRQYSIGYYPKQPGQPGQSHQIRVRAKEPNLAVRARENYIYAPSGSNTVADGTTPNRPVLRKLDQSGRPSTKF
jgi:Ca-activated chloride channel homolog